MGSIPLSQSPSFSLALEPEPPLMCESMDMI